MKALCWTGLNKLAVENVDEPTILNPSDAIVKVTLSTSCGSDLHLLGGYVPGMRAGDILGHEFMGEIVAVGSGVQQRQVGDRVVVCSFMSCGNCWYRTPHRRLARRRQRLTPARGVAPRKALSEHADGLDYPAQSESAGGSVVSCAGGMRSMAK